MIEVCLSSQVVSSVRVKGLSLFISSSQTWHTIDAQYIFVHRMRRACLSPAPRTSCSAPPFTALPPTLSFPPLGPSYGIFLLVLRRPEGQRILPSGLSHTTQPGSWAPVGWRWGWGWGGRRLSCSFGFSSVPPGPTHAYHLWGPWATVQRETHTPHV